MQKPLFTRLYTLGSFLAFGWPLLAHAQVENTVSLTAQLAQASSPAPQETVPAAVASSAATAPSEPNEAATAPADAVATSVLKKKTTKINEDLRTLIGLNTQAQSYSSSSAVDSGLTQQIEMQLTFKKRGLFFSNTEITLGSFTVADSFYYALPEAYIGYGTKQLNYSVGRKIENLSFTDSFFNLGLMQAYSTNDYINFKESGLTGLSLHSAGDGYGFNLAYNPMFIPNSGASVKVQGGKVTTTNRWANTPPEQFRFGDQNREIIYAITDYSLSDIIFNPGYVANLYLGNDKYRPGVLLTYAYKPLNDVVLSHEQYGDIATFHGNVILNPVVFYHQVYAVDINFDSGNFKSTFSYLGDQPDNKAPKEFETTQQLEAMNISSIYLGYDLTKMMGRKLEMYVAGAVVSGGGIKDVNAAGQESQMSYSSSRTQYKKPIKAGIKGEMMQIYDQPLTADISLIHDVQLKGSLLSANFKYAANRNLSVNAGFDLLGVEDDAADPAQSNFLEQNKANDRVTAGVGYAF